MMTGLIVSVPFDGEDYDLEYFFVPIPSQGESGYKQLEITVSIKNWLFSTPATWNMVWTPNNEISFNLHKSGPFSKPDFALAVVGGLKAEDRSFSEALRSCFVLDTNY